MDARNLKFQHGQAHGQQHKGHGDGHTLTAGVEELLHPVQQPAHGAAQQQRQEDLQDRFHHHCQHTDLTMCQSRGNAERHGEQQQAHRIIDGHHQHDHGGEQILRHDEVEFKVRKGEGKVHRQHPQQRGGDAAQIALGDDRDQEHAQHEDHRHRGIGLEDAVGDQTEQKGDDQDPGGHKKVTGSVFHGTYPQKYNISIP